MKQPILQAAVVLVLLLTMPVQIPAQAQVTPDRTLRNPSRTRRDRNVTVITGGTQAGNSLFHSFRNFSVPRNHTASFRDISPDVSNIFSRVTGSSVSRINGMIEALQSNGSLSSANFFLINPNGIQFGRHASLNIGGSFLATTADRVWFDNGTQFSAVTPKDAPLLTVNVPVGLQFGPSPGSSSGMIRNQSRSNLIRDEFDAPIAGGLQVPTGQTLALIGRELDFSGGYATAFAGRIELSSVVSGEVSLQPLATGWRLGYTNAQLGDMRFANEATLNTSGSPGGGVQIQGRAILLTGDAAILSDTSGNQTGADLLIAAEDLQMSQFALISTFATEQGNGGNITITADRFTADSGAAIVSRTEGAGNAGNLTIRASESVELSGEGSVLPNGDFALTGLFVQTDPDSAGQSGNLTLSTRLLEMQQGAQVVNDTSGAGRAGTIRLRAENINLSGVLRDANGEVVLDAGLPFPTGIFADSNATATAKGGAIEIDTQRLNLQSGAVLQTNAEGAGDAGNLTIRATEAIQLSGTAGSGLPPTTIFAASGGLPGEGGGGTSTATGRGGTLQITTPELTATDRAVIAVGSLNPDQLAEGAGDLNIQAERIQLTNQGRLVAETASGNGGDINLRVRDAIVLRNNSQVSTSAGIENQGGNGGNVKINTNYIFAAPTEDSDIRANAFTGSGGNVTITAQGILGIEPRSAPTNFSDITASSQFGTPGQVVIRSPDVDPNTPTTELPATPLSDRPVQGCEVAQSSSTAEFFNTGRSGLPLTPYEPLSSSEILTDVRLPVSEPTVNEPTVNEPIVEAQRWLVNHEGAVVLVAENPSNVHHCQLRASPAAAHSALGSHF